MSLVRTRCLAGKKGLSVYINQGVVLSLSDRGDSPATDALFAGVQTTAPTTNNQIGDDDLPF